MARESTTPCVLVVVPTYNERENLATLAPRIRAASTTS